MTESATAPGTPTYQPPTFVPVPRQAGPEGPMGPHGEGFPPGGSMTQILNKQSSVEFDAEWIAPLMYSLETFGGSTTNVLADNSAALTAAIAAVQTSNLGKGTIYLSAGRWNFQSTVQWSNGVMLQGAGVDTTTVNFTGTGYWLDYPHVGAWGGGVQDMTINVSATGSGAIRMGSFATRLSGANEHQSLRNLFLKGPGSQYGGTCGLTLYALATSLLENINIYNFERGSFWETTTANVVIRLRHVGCRYAFEYNATGAVLETSLDQFFWFEALGPFSSSGSTDGYAIKCSGQALRIYEPDIEMAGTETMKTAIWLTSAVGGGGLAAGLCRIVGGDIAVAPGQTLTTPILIDSSNVVNCVFDGLSLSMSGTAGPSSVVAAVAVSGVNTMNMAVNCNQTLNDSLIATGNMLVSGPSGTSGAGTLGLRLAAPHLVGRDATTSYDQDLLAARANQLCNGGLDVWQRGSGAFTANGAYTADRWAIIRAGTDTMSVSQNTANVDIGSLACAAVTFVLGTGGGGSSFTQSWVVANEGSQLNGRTVSLSMRVRTSTGSAARLLLNSNSNNASSAYHSGGGTYETLTCTLAVPSNATTIYAGVQFTASCTAYIDNAMLVVGGPVAYAPLAAADDLARCQRYYEVIGVPAQNDLIIDGIATAGAQFAQRVFQFKAVKPVTPTITIVGTWILTNCSGQPIVAVSSTKNVVIRATATAAGQFYASNGPGGTANQCITVEANP